MITLKDINSLKASCSAAPSVEPSVVLTYNDTGVVNAEKGVTTIGSRLSNSISQIIGPPPSRINRDVVQISVLNTDTQTQTITVYFSQSGVDFKLFTAQLLPSEKLEFTQDDGWNVYDAYGFVKISSSNRRVHETTLANATLVDIYTVPVGKRARVTMVVCNIGNTNRRFRVAISKNGAAITNSHYTHYDNNITDRSTHEDGIVYELEGGDIVRVYGSTADVTFTLNGVEY